MGRTERAGVWFGLALLPVFLLFSYLILTRRMPNTHDTFQFFTLQYAFLNGAATAGEIPRWFPFFMHGMASPWWYQLQASLLQNVLSVIAPVLRHADFLPLFYAGLAVDAALLAAGSWLLARRLLPSLSGALLVTFTAVTSAVWTSQPWFNFHMVYAVPLILHFLHRFLETGRWRYAFFAGNLLAVQSAGNLPYFLPVVSLVTGFYFLFYVALDPSRIRPAAEALRRPWAAFLCLAGVALSFLPIYLLMKSGMEQTVSYLSGRNPDGTVPLQIYLTYGGRFMLKRWGELVTGVSMFDCSLYIGIPAAFLALRGAFSVNRRTLHLLPTVLAVAAVSMATPLAVLAYHAWPMMNYFRHLSLLAPFVRLFLCFLAGAGWEALREDSSRIPKRMIRTGLLLLAWTAFSLFLFHLSSRLQASNQVVLQIFEETLGFGRLKTYFSHLLWPRVEMAAWAAAVFALFYILLLQPDRVRRFRPALLGCLLAAQIGDLSAYRLSDAVSKTHPLHGTASRLTRFEPVPFLPRRTAWKDSAGERAVELSRIPLRSSVIAFTLSFIFLDEPGSTLRIDYWPAPIDRFMRAYWNQPLDPSSRTAGLVPETRLEFPLEHPAARKMAAIDGEKIRFFSRAFRAGPDADVAAAMTAPAYGGGFPLLQGPAAAGLTEWDTGRQLDLDAALPIPYRVDRFDANRLELSVEVPGDSPAWMFYSDVWHPDWNASVNGKRVPVYRANLAYKAVPVEAGRNRIRLEFRSPILEFCSRLFSFWSLAWLIGLAVILWKIFSERKVAAGGHQG